MSHVAVLVPGIWNTKKRRADPSFGDSSLFHPTSPPIHSFPLLSTCCLILTVLIFSLYFGNKVSWIPLTFHVRKDVNKERITTCHSSLHFTLGKITIDQYHIITFDQFNIITLTITESFSANQCRQDQWTVRFGVPRHVIWTYQCHLTLLEQYI